MATSTRSSRATEDVWSLCFCRLRTTIMRLSQETIPIWSSRRNLNHEDFGALASGSSSVRRQKRNSYENVCLEDLAEQFNKLDAQPQKRPVRPSPAGQSRGLPAAPSHLAMPAPSAPKPPVSVAMQPPASIDLEHLLERLWIDLLIDINPKHTRKKRQHGG